MMKALTTFVQAGARARRRVFAPFALIALAACATSADPVDDTPKGAQAGAKLTSVELYCDARAAAECNELVVSKCKAPNKDACVKARTALCLKGVPQGTTFVPKFADACVAAARTMLTDAKIASAEMKRVNDACGARLFSGPGAVREPCTNDYDCRSDEGLVCFLAFGETRGKCLKPSDVESGGSCKGEADRCAEDHFCEDASKTCQPRGAAGTSCHQQMKPCMLNLRCPPANPFASMTCQKGAGAGQACKLDNDCDDGMCVRASKQSEGTCAPEIELTSIETTCGDFK